MGLVEVVDVEHEIALRGGEAAEVGEVGVTAQLDPDARLGHGGQVCGHGKGGPPEIGEGRSGHATVADGIQFGHPSSALLCQEG